MYFNVCASLECGQVFRWFKTGGAYNLIAKDSVFELQQERDGEALIETNSDLSDNEIFSYFGLNHDLEKIYRYIDKDKYTHDAIKRFSGLRVFEQDPWETLVTYICSSNSNIPNIHMMLNNLSHKFGEKIKHSSATFYTYPKPEVIANASLDDIKACKLGFRSRYMLETAKIVASNDFDIYFLKKLKYDALRAELTKLPGVGPKVADCVSLFGFQKFESFPVDVWARRFMMEYYKISNLKQIWEFARRYFGEYAGYAQEYLFYNRRISK